MAKPSTSNASISGSRRGAVSGHAVPLNVSVSLPHGLSDVGGLPVEQCAALRRYGMQLGYAFQIADDLLDYVSDAGTLGKNIGDDLAEGKPTLPLIYALQRADAEQKQSLRHAIEHGGLDSLDRIIAAIRDSGALERTHERAVLHADAARDALRVLPDSPWRDAMATLADYSVQRSF